MPTACLALKLGLMALFIAFTMKLLRESIAARTLALYASPFILFVVFAVPSNPLNLPVTGALAAFAIVLSAKSGANMLGTIIFAVVLILLAAARVARAVLALSPLALLMRRHVFALTALAWAARG